jgi:predicted ATPase
MPTNTEERPRVYLNKVHLKGFKSIEDVTIDFQKGLNILIGKNGSGKSNFMEVINIALSSKRENRLPFKSSRLEFKSIDNHDFVLEVEREALIKSEKGYLSDRIGFVESFSIDDRMIFDNSKNGSVRFKYNDRIIFFNNIPFVFTQLGYRFYSVLYIKFDLPKELGCIESPGVINIVEEEDGYWDWNFPNSLRFLDDMLFDLQFKFVENEDNSIEFKDITSMDIIEKLKVDQIIIDNLRLYSSIEDVRVNDNISIYYQENTLAIDNVRLDFKVNGNWLPWSLLSDGTRRLFYIIAEVTNSEGLAFIEEPELGVHPHQFHLLMSFLKEQSEHKQIIISTHAPKALDHLTFEELNNILITYYDPEKGTQLKHLSDNEKDKAVAFAKEVGFLSDYWLHSDLEE